MREMVTIVHNKYRRITDVVMKLDFPLVVRFTVDLFSIRPGKNGTGLSKPNYYSEYEYNIDGEDRVTVMRQFSYFLEIVPMKDKAANMSVVITPEYIYYFKRRLMDAIKGWFIGDAANKTFGRRNGNYVLRDNVEPIKIGCAFDTYIEFEPCVGVDKHNTQMLGVRIYINSDENSYFVSIDSMFMLYEFLSTFNMYIAAQNMLSYMGKPRYGTNQNSYNKNGSNGNNGIRNTRSFFDN